MVIFGRALANRNDSTDAFSTYQAATGGVLDENTGLLRITPAQFANLQSLFFNIGGVRALCIASTGL